jgi:hypothetical protein
VSKESALQIASSLRLCLLLSLLTIGGLAESPQTSANSASSYTLQVSVDEISLTFHAFDANLPQVSQAAPYEQTGLPVELGAGRVNRRSLHYAPPDFLWNLVALANFMRLSLLKGARATPSSAGDKLSARRVKVVWRGELCERKILSA